MGWTYPPPFQIPPPLRMLGSRQGCKASDNCLRVAAVALMMGVPQNPERPLGGRGRLETDPRHEGEDRRGPSG